MLLKTLFPLALESNYKPSNLMYLKLDFHLKAKQKTRQLLLLQTRRRAGLFSLSF